METIHECFHLALLGTYFNSYMCFVILKRQIIHLQCILG